VASPLPRFDSMRFFMRIPKIACLTPATADNGQCWNYACQLPTPCDQYRLSCCEKLFITLLIGCSLLWITAEVTLSNCWTDKFNLRNLLSCANGAMFSWTLLKLWKLFEHMDDKTWRDPLFGHLGIQWTVFSLTASSNSWMQPASSFPAGAYSRLVADNGDCLWQIHPRN